jgi:hypothetical protein
MGTHAVYAFCLNKRYYYVYAHNDGSLNALGRKLLDFLLNLTDKDWTFLKSFFDNYDKIEDDLDIVMLNNDDVEVVSWSTLFESERMKRLQFLTKEEYKESRECPVNFYGDLEYYYQIDVETRLLHAKYITCGFDASGIFLEDHVEYEYTGPVCDEWLRRAQETFVDV